jgi:hypothetical protein
LVESATLPEERRIATTLAALARQQLPPAAGPVVLAVGEVFRDPLALRQTLDQERSQVG